MLFNIFLFFMIGGLVLYAGLFLMMYLSSVPKFNNAKVVNKSLSNQYYYKPDSIVHAMNGNFFSLGSTELENTDRETFEVIAYNLAKDKKQIYYNNVVIEDADPSSFVPLFTDLEVDKYPYVQYSKDKNYVYYLYNKIADAKPESFEHFAGDFTRDEFSLFYWDEKLCSLKIGGQDITPQQVKNDDKSVYCQVADKMFFKNLLFESVDSDSFIAIKDEYSKDKHFVYLKNNILHGMDSDTFEVLNDSYQRDYKYLYYNRKIIPNGDPASYQYFDILFSRDKNKIYYCGREILDIEIDSFTLSEGKKLDENRKYVNLTIDEHLCLFALRKECIDILEFPNDKYSSRHCRYKNNIYYGYTKIIGIDLDSFSIVPDCSQGYCKDENNVYFGPQRINGADPKTFIAIDDVFSKDKNHVYYTTNKVKGQTPDSFVYQEDMWCEDVSEGIVTLKMGHD